MILSIVKLEKGHYEIIWFLLLIKYKIILVLEGNIAIHYAVIIIKKVFDFESNTELKYVQLYIWHNNWDR